ncbi:MAG: hypothetical protein KGD67_01120 [Candidatus Lokiarchaeota archaeon]|nr:hypothetical protein [Candidatus Lokiarchaeota archaeon]
MYNSKTLIGELLGAAVAIIWIAFAFFGAGNMLFLVVAISLTILLGTISGGLIALSKKEVDYKEVLGWLFGAAIGVVWVAYALLDPSNMLFLVVAISLTIVFGVLSGGIIKLSAKNKEK